jgi:hypothetical protein
MDFTETNLKKDINEKLDKVFSVLESVAQNKTRLIKTASTNNKSVLPSSSDENLKITSSVNEIIEAQGSTSEDIKLEENRTMIVSKEIKDPNYEAYITKVAVTKNSEKIFMVSYFLRELYLGRYLINRNLYFLKNNHAEAKKAYKELIAFTEETRESYYSEEIASINLPIKLQNHVIDMSGDFDFKDEDILGTSVKRKQMNESTVYDWFRSNEVKLKEQRRFFDNSGEE